MGTVPSSLSLSFSPLLHLGSDPYRRCLFPSDLHNQLSHQHIWYCGMVCRPYRTTSPLDTLLTSSSFDILPWDITSTPHLFPKMRIPILLGPIWWFSEETSSGSIGKGNYEKRWQEEVEEAEIHLTFKMKICVKPIDIWVLLLLLSNNCARF